jgi:hypothetical protein
MATITFDTVQAAHRRGRLESVLAALRDALDAFVSVQLRRTAAEAEHIRPRQPPRKSSPSLGAR